MKFGLIVVVYGIAAMACVIANNTKDTDNDVGDAASEETCQMNQVVEALFGLIFYLKVNYNNGRTELFMNCTSNINVIHLIYSDSYRIIAQGMINEMVPYWTSRIPYFLETIASRAEELILETTGATDRQRSLEYQIGNEPGYVDFIFDCQFPANCSTLARSNNDEIPRCTARAESFKKYRCRINTVRISPLDLENQNMPWTPSLLRDIVVPCYLRSRLSEARRASPRNRLLYNLYISTGDFFAALNFRNIMIVSSHRTTIRSGMRIDMRRLIDDNNYFKRAMQNFFRSELKLEESEAGPSREYLRPHFERMRPDIPQPWQCEVAREILFRENSSSEPEPGPSNPKSRPSFHSELFRSLAQEHLVSQLENSRYTSDQWMHQPQMEAEHRAQPPLTTTTKAGSGRSKRSSMTTAKQNDAELEAVVEKRLRSFFFVSLKDQTNLALHQNSSYEWSRYFIKLYKEFQDGDWTNVFCEYNKFGFANFLMSKLYRHPDWINCIFQMGSVKEYWCLAIRRIIFDTDERSELSWLDESFRPRQFTKDRQLVFQELDKISDLASTHTTSVVNENHYEMVKYDDSVINLASVFLSFAQYTPCMRKHVFAGRKKRSDGHRVKYYEGFEWLIDSNGQPQCLLN